ncbi:MAG TPA: ammonium transporter [Planctomycetota bacterium]|nr:ammonium transporter [Planctomycetota bacterium]
MKLTYVQKFRRLRERLRDPQWRRYGKLLFAGKLLGVGGVLFLMIGMPFILKTGANAVTITAHAEEAPKKDEAKKEEPKPKITISPADGYTPNATAVTFTATELDKEGNKLEKQPTFKWKVSGGGKIEADKDGNGVFTPSMVGGPYTVTAEADSISGDTSIKVDDTINPLNTVWTLVAAFLVFGMQVGFTMLEAGFCRSRETVNVLVECVFDTCLCGILFYAFGYAFMFSHGNGFIGYHWFFLQNAPLTYESTGVALLAHWIFQFAFADTCSTITSGAMIGRTAFVGDILYSICVTGFIYPIIGHWAWGPDGFLYTMGGQNASDSAFTHFFAGLNMNFHDFAGSTVVHTIGGMVSLAGAIVLGPRLGRRFKRDGGAPMLPHDLTIAVSGGLLLWFGWYGFNPGSTLSAMDMQGIGRVAANTTLAACTGGMGAVFFLYFKSGKWDAGAITNGFLAGLVAITCPCYWVSPTGACLLGLIAGFIVMLGIELLEFLRIDDPIGAVPVHGICGIWGTLSLGLFASGEYAAAGSGPAGVPSVGPDNPALTGLFYGGGTTVLAAQAIGSACITLATLLVSFVVMKVIMMAGLLRLPKDHELHGMDLSEHGISAYPEYVISPSAAPGGMSPEMVNAVSPSTQVSTNPA